MSSKINYNRKDIMAMAKIVAEKNNLKLGQVLAAFNLYYEKIKSDIVNFKPREVDLSSLDDDVSVMSFNILKIGKMYTNPKIIKAVNERVIRNESIKYKKSDSN